MIKTSKKKSKIKGTDKKVKHWIKTKNVTMTIYFGFGILLMVLMILILIGIIKENQLANLLGF